MTAFYPPGPPVALRKESVDRNKLDLPLQVRRPVALRKESVDRNLRLVDVLECTIVALRKESVDRNGIEKRLDGF